MSVKLYMDENVPRQITLGLRLRGLDVVMRPHSQDFDNAFILKNLIDQPMLNVNST